MRLPDFLIIGASKSGTTSLHAWLDEHPRVFMSPVKETNFFAYAPQERPATHWGSPVLVEFPIRSLEEYAALFAAAPEGVAIGEASPVYLESAVAPARIHETLPNVRLVVTLRNPADRAYSGYWMAVRHGHESRPPQGAFGPHEHRVRSGLFHGLLARYFEMFGRERIHVILFEDLVARPLAVFRDLCRFLNVDDRFAPDVARLHNRGGVPRVRWLYSLLTTSRLRRWSDPWIPAPLRRAARGLRNQSTRSIPPLPPELRHQLIAFFRDDIVALEKLIGRDLSRWRVPRSPPAG